MSMTSFVDDSAVIHFQQNGTDILTVKEEDDKKTGRLKVSLSGRLNRETFPGFFDELSALISMNVKITLNLQELIYIDSGAISSLVRLEQQAEQKGIEDGLVLSSLPPAIYNALRKVGATDLLLIE